MLTGDGFKKNTQSCAKLGEMYEKNIMLDKNTREELRSFDGICNALRFLGKNPNNTNGIKNCCEGIANTAYGYSWKYFE